MIADYESNPKLKGAGNSSIQHTYQFIDDDIIIGNSYQYKLADLDYAGRRTFHKAVSISTQSSKYLKDEPIADEYLLLNNYPNPFNPSTAISFSIPNSEKVRVTIYNGLGQHIATLVDEELSAGKYTFRWSAQNNSAGVYYYHIETNSFNQTKKMILIK